MYDIAVIGAGPAGYTAAIKASQAGLNVVLFEKDLIGGTCLNKGCIPTKTILYSCNLLSELKNADKYGISADNISFDFIKIQERQKEISAKLRKALTGVIKNHKITIIEEEANVIDSNTIITKNDTYKAKNIIIATGSTPNTIKFPGTYDSNFILTSDDVLNLSVLPESIIIAGSGAIGTEWARIFSSLGTKVTVVEIMKNIIPSADYEVSQRIARIFKRNKIDVYTETSIQEINGNNVKLSNGKELTVDCILIAAGRQPEVNFGEINKAIKTDKFVETSDNYRTKINNIYAIGDVNGKSLLAHSAIKQAEDLIEFIVNGKSKVFDKNLVPSVIYGSPEIASIGCTEQFLIENKTKYKKSIFPVSALGKAHSEDKIEGFIKILADEEKILGTHIISEEASAMIEQIAVAMKNNISPEELKDVIYAHPTYSEGIHESLLTLKETENNI